MTMTWSSAPAMTPRAHRRVRRDAERRPRAVIGGFDTEAVQVQMDAELYDPAANSWTLTSTDNRSTLLRHLATAAAGRPRARGRRLRQRRVQPGRERGSLRSRNEQLDGGGAAARKRVYAASVSLPDGRVLVIGGAQGTPTDALDRRRGVRPCERPRGR